MANNSNFSTGSGRYASGNQMAAYDKLPPTARAALANAAFDWATTLARHRKAQSGYRSGQEIAASVHRWDKKQHAPDVERGIVP